VSVPYADPILLCYDGSAGARRAIATTAGLFPGRAAIVLHVWRPVADIAVAYSIMPGAAYDPVEPGRSARQLAEEGAGAAESTGSKPIAQIAEVEMDAVWHAILTIADRDDVAALVLGSRGLSPLRSVVPGSLPHAVAQHAHRPVLVVPPAPHAEAFPEAESQSETLAAS
jgi:nucleotide-binding universal stress UspA family protein